VGQGALHDDLGSEFRGALQIAGLPVTVPACLFADIESLSGTGLIITERITYGRNGVEALYPKCMDYTVPEPVEHYKAILKGLARLSGAHRNGRLSPEFDRKFPYNRKQASAVFALRAPEEKLIQRANRMFDFIGRYPKLFPENVRSPGSASNSSVISRSGCRRRPDKRSSIRQS